MPKGSDWNKPAHTKPQGARNALWLFVAQFKTQLAIARINGYILGLF
jgi:hypothetical protein